MKSIVKYALVLIWIAILGVVASAALRGKAANLVLGIGSVPVRGSLNRALLLSGEGLAKECPQPVQIYNQWVITYRETSPMAPVSTILDEMWPGWQTSPCSKDPNTWIADWERSFNIVERWLVELTIKSDSAGGLYAITPETMPAALRREIDYSQFIRLPQEAITWAENRRAEEANRSRILDLTNTGIIAVVLGAFGSVLFLLYSLLGEGRTSTPLAVKDILFRPFFGAFLALALLIADLVAHTILSTSNVFQMRRESMWALALAAGLLSEKAYQRLESGLSTRISNEPTSKQT